MSEKSYYEQTDAQFKIRLPHELKDKIRASADEHNRTMTADIVARLEHSFRPSGVEISQDGIKTTLSEPMYQLVAHYANECDLSFDKAVHSLLYEALEQANYGGLDKAILIDALKRRLETMNLKQVRSVCDFIGKIS